MLGGQFGSSRSARIVLFLCLVVMGAMGGCGDGDDGGSPSITTEKQPFSAYRDGQKLKRCVGPSALRVGGFDLRIAGRMTCSAAASLVIGFAPHAGETVQRLHGFTCYSRPQRRIGLLVICIDDDKVFRFNIA